MRRLWGIPYILWLFALVQIGIYVYGSTRGPHFAPPDFARLMSLGAAYSPKISLGQWWLPITALFVHLRLLHLILGSLTLLLVGKAAQEFKELEVTAAFIVAGLASSITSIYITPYSLYGGDLGAVLGLYSTVLTFRLVRRETHAIRDQQLIYAAIPTLILLPMLANSALGLLDYALLMPPLIAGVVMGLCLNGVSQTFYFAAGSAIGVALACTVFMPFRPDLLQTLTAIQEQLSQYQSALTKYRELSRPKLPAEFAAQRKFISEQLLQPLLQARVELTKLESSSIRKKAVQELILVQTLTAEAKWTLLGFEESEKLVDLEAQFKAGRISAEQASYEIATVLFPKLNKAKGEITDLLNLPEFDEAIRKGVLTAVNTYSKNVRKDLEHRMAILEEVALSVRLGADVHQYFKILGPKYTEAEAALNFMSADFKKHLDGAKARHTQMTAYFVDIDPMTRQGLAKTINTSDTIFNLLQIHATELVLKNRFANLSTQLTNRNANKKSSSQVEGSLRYVESSIEPLFIPRPSRETASVTAMSNPSAKFQALHDMRRSAIQSLSDALKGGAKREALQKTLQEWENINNSALEKELFMSVVQIQKSLRRKPD